MISNLTPYIGPGSLDPEMARNAGDLLLHEVTWEHLKRLRKKWQGTLVIKGVLDPDDAILAVDAGAEAIWVSNHGGRLLESTPAAIDALPHIRLAVGDRVKVGDTIASAETHKATVDIEAPVGGTRWMVRIAPAESATS